MGTPAAPVGDGGSGRPVIEVRGLTKRFGPTLALDGLSFSVEAGSITGFLGPNGAGKTTTLRVLLGLVHPTAGTAQIHGRPYAGLPEPVRSVGALLETSGFHPGRTAANHLLAQCHAAAVRTSRIDEVLGLVGLRDAARRRIGGFSMGMRQRLGLACALLGEPEVLLLDEPANGLDPDGMRWLRGFLKEHAAGGGTVLVSSHVLAEVAQTVDEVLIVSKGRLVDHASIQELTGRTSEVVRVRTPDAAELRRLLKAEGLKPTLGRSGELLVKGTTTEAVGTLAARNGLVVLELTVEAANLEEVFLSLTSDRERDGDQEDEEVPA